MDTNRPCTLRRVSGAGLAVGVVAAALVALIEQGGGPGEVASLARSQGMRTLLEDGLDKVRDGITTLVELRRIVSRGESA